MSGQYEIDGLDFYDTYGGIVSKGLGDLLKPWDAKEPPVKKDWADQHGLDMDTGSTYFAAKEVNIEFAIVAATVTDFWLKYDAFIAMLMQPGLRRFYSNSLDRSFFLKYQKCTLTVPLTKFKSGKVGVKYSFTFLEPVPSFFKQFTYMTDENGNYITTPDGQKILVA